MRLPFDLTDYSPYQLLLAGRAAGMDYDDADAVEQYLHLHPDASRAGVEFELHSDAERHADVTIDLQRRVHVKAEFEDTESPDNDDLVAYRAGKQAFVEGMTLDSNPYDGGTAMAEDWELGWITEAEADTTLGAHQPSASAARSPG